MKAVIALVFIFFAGISAQARDISGAHTDPSDSNAGTPRLEKVAAFQAGIVTIQVNLSGDRQMKQEVARLYRRSGSRIKKELQFATKKDFGMA